MPEFSELRPSQLLAEEEKRRDALAEAKQSGDRKKLQKAKAAVDELRSFQRSQRQPADGETVASPDTVRATGNTMNGA